MTLTHTRRCGLLAGSATLALAVAATAVPALAVVPNETTTPADIVDTDDEYRGVGMFFRADGFVCTGTLINPRTVLFAAHCVNDLPEEAYNADDIPAAWSFNVNALPGFQNWFANNFASNPDLAVFNVNRIFYNAQSLQNPQAAGFITYSQSSDPANPHYSDFTRAYAARQWQAFPFTAAEIRAQKISETTLRQ